MGPQVRGDWRSATDEQPQDEARSGGSPKQQGARGKKRPRTSLEALAPLPGLELGSLGPLKEGFMPSVLTGGGAKEQRHARGNWPSHVYAPLTVTEALLRLAVDAIDDARGQLPEGLSIKPCFSVRRPGGAGKDGGGDTWKQQGPEADWAHLSLSRPFSLRRHELEPFEAALRETTADMEPFTVVLPRYKWSLLGSDDHERTFLVLDVEEGEEELQELVEKVDQAMTRFGRPQYYEEPHFHITVAEVGAPFTGDMARLGADHGHQCKGAPRDDGEGGSTPAAAAAAPLPTVVEIEVESLIARMGHYKKRLGLLGPS